MNSVLIYLNLKWSIFSIILFLIVGVKELNKGIWEGEGKERGVKSRVCALYQVIMLSYYLIYVMADKHFCLLIFELLSVTVSFYISIFLV